MIAYNEIEHQQHDIYLIQEHKDDCVKSHHELLDITEQDALILEEKMSGTLDGCDALFDLFYCVLRSIKCRDEPRVLDAIERVLDYV